MLAWVHHFTGATNRMRNSKIWHNRRAQKKASRLLLYKNALFSHAVLLHMILLTRSSQPSYRSKLAATRQRANSARASPTRRSAAGAGLPELTGGLLVGAMPAICGPTPPSDGIGVGDGPRYVSKKDDVGGGISGGNWCGPARNGTSKCLMRR